MVSLETYNAHYLPTSCLVIIFLTCSEKVSARSVSTDPLGGSTISWDLKIRLEPCGNRLVFNLVCMLPLESILHFCSNAARDALFSRIQHIFKYCNSVFECFIPFFFLQIIHTLKNIYPLISKLNYFPVHV